MPVDAKAVLDRASETLQDKERVRWPVAELLLWLNDGLREVILLKPTAASKSIAIQLARGSLQRVPDGCISILRVVCNLMTANGARQALRSIRAIDGDVLAAQCPDWQNERRVRFTREVRSVVYDAADPKAFYTFPGNDGSGIVEAIVSRVPAPLQVLTDAGPNIVDIDDIYANALLDYVLYRAYSKDAEFVGSAARAQAHYVQFANALGVSIKNKIALNPNVKPGIPQESAA